MKKTSLSANFQKGLEIEKQKTEPTTEEAVSSTNKPAQASRHKKKGIVAYVHPAVAKQLKLLSTETEKTQQDLLIEAVNDLFEKYGKKGIA